MIELRPGWKMRQCYMDDTPYWIVWEGDPIDGESIWGAAEIEESAGDLGCRLFVSTRADQSMRWAWEWEVTGKEQESWTAIMVAAEDALNKLAALAAEVHATLTGE